LLGDHQVKIGNQLKPLSVKERQDSTADFHPLEFSFKSERIEQVKRVKSPQSFGDYARDEFAHLIGESSFEDVPEVF